MTYRISTIATTAVAAFLLAAGPTRADDSQGNSSQKSSKQQGQSQQDQKQKDQQKQSASSGGQKSQSQGGSQNQGQQQQNVRGKVIGLAVVGFTGSPHKHVVATIQQKNGSIVLADMGTIDQVRRSGLHRGQEIDASGRPTRINDAPGIIVVSVRPTAGQTGANQQGLGMGQQQQQQQGQASRDVVRGRITDTREVKLKGSNTKHLLAKVQTRGGETRLIDLGQASNARNLNLQKGEFLAARGNSARFGNSQILMANEFSDGRRVLSANRQSGRSGQQQQQQQQQARPGQSGSMDTLVVGTIQDVRGVNIKGISDKHQLVKMQATDGRTIVLDLGAEKALKDLDLRKGDTVVATGRMGQINGKAVIFADRVAEVTSIQRSGSKSGNKGSQQQTASDSGRSQPNKMSTQGDDQSDESDDLPKEGKKYDQKHQVE